MEIVPFALTFLTGLCEKHVKGEQKRPFTEAYHMPGIVPNSWRARLPFILTPASWCGFHSTYVTREEHKAQRG